MGITPLARRGVPWPQPRFGTRVLVMETRTSLIIVPFAVNKVGIVSIISLRLIEARTGILIAGKLHPGLATFDGSCSSSDRCLHATLCIPLKALTDADADQRR